MLPPFLGCVTVKARANCFPDTLRAQGGMRALAISSVGLMLIEKRMLYCCGVLQHNEYPRYYR